MTAQLFVPSWEDRATRLLVLGASGRIGLLLLDRCQARGHHITAQTRDARKLDAMRELVGVIEADPLDQKAIHELALGQDAVIFALGIDRLGRTTLFSDVTRHVLAAMQYTGVRRLIAITGVGAGETRGHGGILYDRFIFPLLTRQRYADKELQEAPIRASRLDWVIVRPARFSDRPPTTALQVLSRIEPDTVLRWIAPHEVADFVMDQLTSDRYLGQAVFIGHA